MINLIPYTIIAQGIYSGIVNAISSIALKTGSLIKSIYTHKNPDVTKILKELDIEFKLHTIESVLKTENISGEDPVKICLAYVHQSINKVHYDLAEIEKRITYHQTKWFNKWRSLHIKSKLEELTIDMKILENRFHEFIELSKFMHNK